MRVTFPPIVLVIALIFPASASAAIWYVNATATGANNGTSWADAYTDLQSALTVAVNGDQIWVASGIYKPSARTDPSLPNSVTFYFNKAIAMYGGFVGSETSLEQRDWENNLTILDGDIVGDDDTTGNKSDNAYHVLTRNVSGTNAILDGLTIRNGYAYGTENNSYGGGIFSRGGTFTVQNCIITRNSSINYGGGIYHYSSYGLTIINTTLSDNVAYLGGAAHLGYGGSVTCSGCLFQNNTASSAGAVVVRESVQFQDCRFIANVATNYGGGAIYKCDYLYNSVNLMRVDNCLFERNSAPQSGGAIISYCYGGTHVTGSTFVENTCQDSNGEGGGAIFYETQGPLKVTDCVFERNSSPRTGGVRVQYASADLVNCAFINNSSPYAWGGGLYNRVADTTVTNCLFADNSAFIGGGAYDSDSNVSYANCTFVGNTATYNSGGLGINNTTGTETVTVSNSIFWGNSDSLGSGESSQINIESGTAAVNYNCVQGWTGAMGGTGNVGNDPLFVSGDTLYHVQDGSPTIDAGYNSLVPADGNDLDGDSDTAELTPLDLDMGPRFVNTPTVADTGGARRRLSIWGVMSS